MAAFRSDRTDGGRENAAATERTNGPGEQRYSAEKMPHSAEQLKVMEEYERAVDEGLVEFARFIKSRQDYSYRDKLKYTILEVSERQASDVKRLTGVDVEGYNNGFSGSSIVHISNRHRKDGTADISTSDDRDIARVGYVLENYDSVDLLIDNNGKQVFSSEWRMNNQKAAPIVVFKKRIDGTVYVAEAVPNTNAKQLMVASAYKNKSGITDQSLHMENNASLQPTSKTSTGSNDSTNEIIPEQSESVKQSFSIDDDSEYLSLAEKYRDGTATEEEATELQRAVEQAESERTNGPGENKTAGTEDGGEQRYSIIEDVEDENGNHYDNAVLLDTDVFDGISPRNWTKALQTHIENRVSQRAAADAEDLRSRAQQVPLGEAQGNSAGRTGGAYENRRGHREDPERGTEAQERRGAQAAVKAAGRGSEAAAAADREEGLKAKLAESFHVAPGSRKITNDLIEQAANRILQRGYLDAEDR